MKYIIGIVMLAALIAAVACDFSEFSQSEKIAENIDDHRTGCEIAAEDLMTAYKQWEANRHYRPGSDPTPEPTRTPRPITTTDIAASVLLEEVWEHGCATGRRDVAGAEQVTLLSLRDHLTILDGRIAALEPTPTVVPLVIPTPTDKVTPTATPTP